MEKSIAFDTILLQTGNNTGIRLPDEVIQQLGAGKKPPVLVTINLFTYPSTVGVMNGVYMIPVSSAVRQSAGVKGGDPIQVIVRLDAEPRVMAVPLDFQQALAANQSAQAFFDSLSPSGKKKYVSLIEGAKSAETRQKRVDKAIADLAESKK
ncbi:YdeI/OmpD-associated family protein [Spirosoma sp.]|uniref:YdeI/OmpD-associated family protein n=1 Tax=Spirosoma sp. TaxID=1899569 RepID=UPI00261E5BD6|nr:YdeI/OmpD-associated family protein [Spirosoma sp.]MCX6215308.1 YdeI/OmpD-associated family protein [Spirosoma sp.]